MLNMQHITQNSKRQDYSDIPCGGHTLDCQIEVYVCSFILHFWPPWTLLGHVGPALDQFWNQMPPCMLIEHIQCIKIILLSTSFGNDCTRFPTIISKFKLLWKIRLSVCENDAISVMSLYTLTHKSAVLIMRWFKHKLALSYWLKWIST